MARDGEVLVSVASLAQPGVEVMTTLYTEHSAVLGAVIIDVIKAEESYDAFATTDTGQITFRVVL